MKESYISDLYVFEEKGKPGQREEPEQVKKGRGIRGDLHFEDPDAPVSICTCFVKEWMKRQEVEGLCFQRFKANIWIETQGEPSGFQKGMQIRCGEASLRSGGGRAGAFRSVQECRKDFPAF